LFLLGLSCREAPVIVENIPCPAGPHSESGNLTVGADDRLYLSWIDVPEHTFMFSTWTGNGWSDPRTIYREPDLLTNWTDLPGLTASSDGTLFAAWQIFGPYAGPTDRVRHGSIIQIATSRDAGRTWSAAVAPHALGRSSQHAFASWAPISADEAALIWLDGDEGPGEQGMTLRFARVRSDGTFTPETVIDERVCDCCPTDLRDMDDGSLLALYRDRSEGEIRDIALAQYDGTRWEAGRVIHADGWKIAGCPVNGPRLDVQGERVALAWFTTDARDSAHVRVAFSDDAGETIGEPIEIAGAQPLGRVDVALLPNGDAWVSWMEGFSTLAKLHLRCVKPSGEMEPVIVAAQVAASRTLPRMARWKDDLFLVWTETVAAHGRVAESSRVLTARFH